MHEYDDAELAASYHSRFRDIGGKVERDPDRRVTPGAMRYCEDACVLLGILFIYCGFLLAFKYIYIFVFFTLRVFLGCVCFELLV